MNLRSSDFDAIQKLGGGIEAINAYLLQVIDESPADFEELVSEYLKGLLDEYSNPPFAVCLLSFLAYCEHGLQEDDIHELFRMCNVQWISIDYVEFLEQFSFFIRVRDNGRLDISHDVIRQCLCDLFDQNKDTVCSMISLYLLNREKHDVITVRTFFDLAFDGKQLQKFSEFIIKNRKVLESKNVDDSTLSAEIRSGIQRLFLKDDGRFILASVKCCDSVEDVVYFHMVVSSALLGINDFYDEDTVLKIAYAVMFIPMHLDLFADDMLFEAELLSCERFLNRHCVSRAKIDELKEICQRTAAKHHKKRGDKKQSEERSLESILSELHKAEAAEKIFIWLKLSKMARSMSGNEDTAKTAEALSFELIRVLKEEKFANESSEEDILYADIYTTLGVVYKTLKEWEKGLYYDGLSLDIYKKLYENTPTDEIYTKYRERVYNIANVAEAWAIEEKNNVQLWSKAKDCYEDCYAMELTAISRGISKRGILQSASSILSLGTALINMGRHEDGMDKYKEGISIIINSAKNNSNPDLYTELSIHMMECVYQLLTCDKKEAAYELASNIREYLTFVINSDLAELKNKITEVCCGFSNEINDIIRRYHAQEDLEGQLLASRILYDMYKVILPVAPYEVRINIIMTKSNICAILFWNLKDYSRAYDEYMELLNFVTEKDLASPDEHGRYADQANSRLIDAYSRALMCLERLEREEELERLIGDAPTWARYFADHIDMIKGDSARVLYEIFSTLMRNKSQLGLMFLMMAFNEVADESYDREAHPETVKMIIEIMSKFSGGNNEEE